MKVYIVTSGSYSMYGIRQVFIDKHKAEIYAKWKNKIKEHPSEFEVEEYETHDENFFIEEVLHE